MKISENYILKTIAGQPVVVPVGEAAANINGMITLNGPAEIIWKGLQAEKSIDAIIKEITAEYDADENTVTKDIDAFVEKLKKYGILED
ncbi:MAG: PqqD family protein [Oscillospiraceae bacterium]|nr:PqqD family protein [Oscillospiraceae bacterium]